jgi:hypothetical protein
MSNAKTPGNFLRALCCVLPALIFFSCRTHKDVSQVQVDNKPTNFLLEQMAINSYKFDHFRAKVATDLELKGKKSSFKTSIRVRKDSAIWSLISKVGFIGPNAIMTQDSVKTVLKQDKKYILSDYKELSECFGADVHYSLMEELLTGNAIGYDAKLKYKSWTDSSYYLISTHSKRQLRKILEKGEIDYSERFITRYWVKPEIFKIAKTVINDTHKGVVLTIEYGDFKDVEGQLFPHEIKLSVTGTGDPMKATLKYSRIKHNKPIDFPFNIPENYEQVRFNCPGSN